jgi:Na+-transporting methylmalonyl-CoA/oxaloacetate decarboxylase gamma subunit
MKKFWLYFFAAFAITFFGTYLKVSGIGFVLVLLAVLSFVGIVREKIDRTTAK